MTEMEIRQQIELTAKQVRDLPAWKRDILVESASPTVRVPRSPVPNQSATSTRQESDREMSARS